jgi:hypothetical protein
MESETPSPLDASFELRRQLEEQRARLRQIGLQRQEQRRVLESELEQQFHCLQQVLLESQQHSQERETAANGKWDWLEHEEKGLRERKQDLELLLEEHRQVQETVRLQQAQFSGELQNAWKNLLEKQADLLPATQLESHPSVNSLLTSVEQLKNELRQVNQSYEQECLERLQLEDDLQQTRRKLENWKDVSSAPQVLQSSTQEADADTIADLQQRLDMALADLRSAKQQIQELQARPANKPMTPAPINGNDWEARKKQLLAQLESDYNEEKPLEQAEKIAISEVIRQTDETLYLKNQEIATFHKRLQEMELQIQAHKTPSQDIMKLLNADELIQQERINLRILQDKLREQLCEAEVNLSLERAKIARERQELDDRMRVWEKQKSGNSATESNTADKKKSTTNLGGRWLARLGLSDEK